MTFRKSTICHHQPRAAVSNHWTPLAIAPQPRGGLEFPEGLNDPLPHWLQWTSAEARATITRRCSICNPSYPRAGGTHLCYLDPLAEAGREGSSPTSPSIQKCYPRTLQGLCRCLLRESLCPPPPLQSMGSCHRSPPQHQTPQRKDIPPLAREPFGLAQYGRITGRSADVIESLHKCNIPIPIVKWVHSFIQDRQATICLDGRWDRLKPVSTGIPQGSCTSPILVAYFTAPMCEAISKGAREKIERDPELSTLMHTGKASHAALTLYVDDRSLAASVHNHNTSTKITELAFQAAHDWLTT